jgi:hypothetical protein
LVLSHFLALSMIEMLLAQFAMQVAKRLRSGITMQTFTV